jgi:sigma-E factor negative regulatory protein RseB
VRALALALAFGTGLAHAQAAPQETSTAEGLALLRKIHQATEKLSYSGTFIYQQGERTETSRITRFASPNGALEKLEVLDGLPREIVRSGDTVKCYLPESQTVKVDRTGVERNFPALLPQRISELASHYVITRGEHARIAGFECDSVVLTPRDGLRYGYHLWADSASGMLLRSRTLNEKGRTVEQFTFTQLTIGGVTRDKVKPRHAAARWRVEDAATTPLDLAKSGWSVNADLPGFRKIVEVRRRLRESNGVAQVVYSDGLAAVSVFIEPLTTRAERARTGLSSLGAINIYTREVANHLVTVVGEAPAASVQRVADRVEYRRPK